MKKHDWIFVGETTGADCSYWCADCGSLAYSADDGVTMKEVTRPKRSCGVDTCTPRDPDGEMA